MPRRLQVAAAALLIVSPMSMEFGIRPIYLMVKGFRPSPITAATIAAATPPTREFAG